MIYDHIVSQTFGLFRMKILNPSYKQQTLPPDKWGKKLKPNQPQTDTIFLEVTSGMGNF